MAPLGSSNVAYRADRREVLSLIPDKQMQINNFSACVFIRQVLPLKKDREAGCERLKNRYVN